MKVKKVLSPRGRTRILFSVDSRDELFVWTRGESIIRPRPSFKKRCVPGVCRKEFFPEDLVQLGTSEFKKLYRSTAGKQLQLLPGLHTF
jgi:hypothetical protein